MSRYNKRRESYVPEFQDTGKQYRWHDGTWAPLYEMIAGRLFLVVSDRDVSRAVQHDRCNCAIAECSKRTYDSDHAEVMDTVAYIGRRIDGREVAAKVQVAGADRAKLIAYDEHGVFEGADLQLLPVRPSQRGEAKNAHQVLQRRRRKAGEIPAASKVPARGRKGPRRITQRHASLAGRIAERFPEEAT